jgi:hypothetical protein
LELDRQLISELSSFSELTVRDFCDRIGRFYAEAEGKAIWGDKTPDYCVYMQTLQRLWPHCRFIHIVRHGIAVAQSMSKHPGYQWLVSAREISWSDVAYNGYYRALPVQKNAVTISDYCRHWYWRIMRTREEARLLASDTYLEVKYEDLCLDPVETLKRIAAFLRLDPDPEWLSTSQGHVRVGEQKPDMNINLQDVMHSREIRLLKELGY